jgi:ribosomal protein L17
MSSHRVAGRKLSRYRSQRVALLRSLTADLVRHERITTTLAKAKETRVVTERLITHGKNGTLHHRRLALAKCPSRTWCVRCSMTWRPGTPSGPAGTPASSSWGPARAMVRSWP